MSQFSVSKVVQAFALVMGLGACSTMREPDFSNNQHAPSSQSNRLAQAPVTTAPVIPQTQARTVAPLQTTTRTRITHDPSEGPLVRLDIIGGLEKTMRMSFMKAMNTAEFNDCALYPRNDESYKNNRWILNCDQPYSNAGTYLAAYVLEKRGEERASRTKGRVQRMPEFSTNAFQG